MKIRKQYGAALSIILSSVLSLGVLPFSASASSFNGVLPIVGTATTITMSRSNFFAGQTATVTITFPTAPLSFTSGDLTVPHGSLSGFTVTGDPRVYTATYTPNSGITASTNSITLNATVTNHVYSGVTSGPDGMASDGTNMWMGSAGSAVSKITPSGTVTTFTSVGSGDGSIAFDGTNMWTGNQGDNSVSKITPTGTITNYPGTGSDPYDIAFDGTNMWTANLLGASVSKISPTGTVTTYTGVGAHPEGIAFDGTNMWTANAADNSVSKITPTGTVTTYALAASSGPVSIAFDGTNMWTSNAGTGGVSKITPSGTVTNYSGTLSSPIAIAFDGTNMWTANNGDNSITKIAPNGAMTTITSVGNLAEGLAFDGTNMWLPNESGTSVTEFGPVVTASSANFSLVTVPVPTVTTSAATSITTATATLNGNITATGGLNATTRGFNYGLTTGYELTPTSETGSFSTGAFTASLTGLTCGTTYHYQSYATHVGGTGTSTPDATFITSPCPAVVATPVVSHGGGMIAIVNPMSPSGTTPTFSIESMEGSVVSLSLSADPSTVKGYVISTKPDFSDSMGILPYNGNATTYQLPDSSPHTIYMKYYSPSGTWSGVVSQTVGISGSATTVSATNTPANSASFMHTLRSGSTGSDVTALQKLLEKDGDLVMPSGASYGYFGGVTMKALGAFQVKYGIVAVGGGGYGTFGPLSRAKANTISN